MDGKVLINVFKNIGMRTLASIILRPMNSRSMLPNKT